MGNGVYGADRGESGVRGGHYLADPALRSGRHGAILEASMRQLENFELCEFGPGETVVYRYVAERPLRDRPILVDTPDGDLRDLIVLEVKVGNVSRFGPGALPASAFAAGSRHAVRVDVELGQPCSIVLQNTGSLTTRARAGIA